MSSAATVIPRHVFRWDLDKTYLRSEFDTVKDLFKAAMEKPEAKRAVPGAPAILRALRAAGGPAHRICIVSGSPTQMRKVLIAKLALDGVEFDEFVLKNNMKNFLRGRFRAMREQVQYKLPALLESRIGTGGAAGETLFGDDAESDATIYSLYADLCAGRVSRGELERVLDAANAYPDSREHALDLAARVPRGDTVQRILIHLDKRSPTAHFDRYGPRLVPIYNYFQAALVLFGDGQLSARDVLGVAREMLASGDYVLSSLANSMQDLLRRGRMAVEPALRLANECLAMADVAARDFGDLPPKDVIAREFLSRVQAMGREGGIGKPPPAPARLDYASLISEERASKKAAKKAGRAAR
jgi:hypothetical protein